MVLTKGPLNGIRVLDLSWVIAGPFGTMLLADMGAEVIKVEAPSGDMGRSVPPVTAQNYGPFFASVNRNKSSVVLDLKTDTGQEALEELVRKSDIVFNNFSPKAARSLGVDHATLSAINPRVICTSIFGFHDQAPYDQLPAFDSVIQAMGGVMSITGEEGGEPVRVGYQIGDLAGGIYAALGALAALQERERTGHGTQVNVSLFDSQLSLLTWQAQMHLMTGEVPRAYGSKHPMLIPNQAFRAGDGQDLIVSATGQHFWKVFCEALERPDIVTDNRFATPQARLDNRGILEPILENEFLKRSRSDWLEIFQQHRIPASPVLDVSQALNHPVAKIRDMVATTQGPGEVQGIPVVGNPIKVGHHKTTFRTPPQLGADSERVLQSLLGYTPAQARAAAGIFDHQSDGEYTTSV